MRIAPLTDHSGLQQVPGTVLLSNENANATVHLDLARNTKGNVILAPQPSGDPNDPLNWPFTKKLGIVLILIFGSCLCASTIGPLLSASLVDMALDLDRPLKDITMTTGYTLLAAACSGFLVSAIGRKLGKRPAFMFCSTMGLIGSIVGATTNTYEGLLAARIIQGFATCAYEALVISVVGDIFFVHERGLWASLMIFSLNCVSNMTPIVCGAISDRLGWPW